MLLPQKFPEGAPRSLTESASHHLLPFAEQGALGDGNDPEMARRRLVEKNFHFGTRVKTPLDCENVLENKLAGRG